MLKVRLFNILTLYDNFVRASRMDPGGNFGQEVQFLRDLVNDKTKSQKKGLTIQSRCLCKSIEELENR